MAIRKLPIRFVRDGARCVRIGLATVAIVAATACAPSPEPTHQTVEYYRANKEAREARVAECSNDPGMLGKTPDCINAKQAAAIEDIGNLRDLPPMGLLKGGEDESAGTNSPDGSARPRAEGDKSREAK